MSKTIYTKNGLQVYRRFDHRLHHVIEAQQFSQDFLMEKLFPLVKQIKQHPKMYGQVAIGKQMISWFEEPSTRTAASFAMAMANLGGQVVFSTENAINFSSRAKGESVIDTFKILSNYQPHVIVARFRESGEALLAQSICQTPIINAGDGNNQHPTQAILDLYTIVEKFGSLENLTIGLVGDLANGRTVKSLAYLASKFNTVRLRFIAPDSLKISQDIIDHLNKRGINFSQHNHLSEIAEQLDVIYMTRPQSERGSSLTSEELMPGRFSLDQATLSRLKSQAIIMHPLPRNQEIPDFVDQDPRAHYFQQAQNGLFVRMALLLMILG